MVDAGKIVVHIIRDKGVVRLPQLQISNLGGANVIADDRGLEHAVVLTTAFTFMQREGEDEGDVSKQKGRTKQEEMSKNTKKGGY